MKYGFFSVVSTKLCFALTSVVSNSSLTNNKQQTVQLYSNNSLDYTRTQLAAHGRNDDRNRFLYEISWMAWCAERVAGKSRQEVKALKQSSYRFYCAVCLWIDARK